MKPRHKILTVVCVALAILVIVVGFRYALLFLRVAFAREQVAIFRHMVEKAVVAQDTEEAERYLEYARNYYPSGTKQVPGSQLDRLVEDAREIAIERIRADMRSRQTR